MYRKVLIGMTVFALLSVLFAACTIRDASTISTGVPVHMGNVQFVQTSVTIKKGQALNLIDDAAVQHIIVNGFWKGSQQVPQKEPGAPAVNLNFSGGDSKPTPPFNTAGKFMLYCTIHGGMQLTVNVQ